MTLFKLKADIESAERKVEKAEEEIRKLDAIIEKCQFKLNEIKKRSEGVQDMLRTLTGFKAKREEMIAQSNANLAALTSKLSGDFQVEN